MVGLPIQIPTLQHKMRGTRVALLCATNGTRTCHWRRLGVKPARGMNASYWHYLLNKKHQTRSGSSYVYGHRHTH